MVICAAALCCVLPALGARADVTMTANPTNIVLKVGTRRGGRALGSGWSRGERRDGRTFRWITHMEADARFTLKTPADVDVALRAAPMYLTWRRQSIGLYMNGRFVTEWVCPDDPDFHDYQFTVPASFLRAGRNRLTLRMAYRRGVPGDDRQLALAVETIVLTPRP